MIKVSPYTPLMFPAHYEGFSDDGYRQVFATTDRILIEAFDAEGSEIYLYDAVSGSYLDTLQFTPYAVNDDVTLYYAVVSGIADGYYAIEIRGYGRCLPFMVTNEKAMLDGTILMQYSMADNKQTDKALFHIDGVQQFFDFRVKGGFKDGGWEFGVANEQFETPDCDIVELTSVDSLQLTLTVGDNSGCPAFIGEMLNTALTCQDIFINGERYAYSGENIEMTQPHADIDRFVFRAKLSRATNIDPAKEIGIRRLLLRKLEDALRQTDIDTPRLIKR